MEAILESIVNGQRKQALEMAKAERIQLADVVAALIAAGMVDEVATIVRVAENTNWCKG